MKLEIVGGKSIMVSGNVTIDYKNGKSVVYNSDSIEHLIVNFDEVISICIDNRNKGIEIK